MYDDNTPHLVFSAILAIAVIFLLAYSVKQGSEIKELQRTVDAMATPTLPQPKCGFETTYRPLSE